MPEQVPENIKTRRASELAELGAVLADVVYEANRDYRGTVLFETYENGINRGHTEHMLEAELEGMTFAAKRCAYMPRKSKRQADMQSRVREICRLSR